MTKITLQELQEMLTEDAKNALMINVIKLSEDSGNCLEYYKNIDTGAIYARIEHYPKADSKIPKYFWCSTSMDGEPDCNLRDNLIINMLDKKHNVMDSYQLKYNNWWGHSFETLDHIK